MAILSSTTERPSEEQRGEEGRNIFMKVVEKPLKALSRDKETLTQLLAKADIQVNGPRDWDIQVHNEEFYKAALAGGTMAIGESYMDGWWDCKALDEMVCRALKAQIEKQIQPVFFFQVILARAINQQSKSRSLRVAEQHYDLGNDLYEKMLCSHMQYTCAYWKNAKNLEEAQRDKLDLVCRKLQLKPGEKVLELGCGWGGFAKFAAENYGVQVTAYNISKEQVAWAREKCKGLPVDIRLQDYREAEGEYDKVVSIGLCEHIGPKNFAQLMRLVHSRLKNHGLFLLHTIGNTVSRVTQDPWIDKYIFPGSVLPSVRQLSESAEGLLVVEDVHNFGADYDKTLMAWYENFQQHWPEIRSEKYNDRFYRMWKYYLLMCAGSFRARKNQLWQFVFSKYGVEGVYDSVR